MVLNEKIFRIIEFPDKFFLKKRQASDSPNLIKIEQIAFELEGRCSSCRKVFHD